MKRATSRAVFLALSIAFAIAPFAFGLFRAVQTGRDYRMIWMAVASAIGAAVVFALGKRGKRGLALGVVFLALIAATAAAGLTGYMLGATAGPGVWMVAFVLGFCWAMSLTFFSFSWAQSADSAAG